MQQVAADTSSQARRAWIALLARAPLEILEAGFKFLPAPAYSWLRAPETGLYMVRGRVGGSGNRFNLGEVTVTRCVVRLSEGVCGIGYVLGRSNRHAELMALADALLQSQSHCAAVRRILLAPIEQHLAEIRRRVARKAEATRVEFLTLARETAASSSMGPFSSEAGAHGGGAA
jgi:alpha-D-ribose 1-methylphosphonate 5-triphosphate synthase subunit PhnG